ncbi:MAG: aldo/keto reductase [Oscillospiraceae bacterium]|nr:aldo/keto reductase [Oscillospiraceae bacterium]
MNYRLNFKNGEKVSLLGFGCMRFPKDFADAEKMVVTAVENGVNYFDTAYIYPGSEVTLGKITEKNDLRSRINIATKLPTFFVKKSSDFDKYFKGSLERLRTDYIDYYLMHMLSGPESWYRLVGLGIKEWIEEKKKSGKIKNLGFSYHGGADGFKALLDAYDWDFTMIQYNYFDENNQAGKSGLLYAEKKGIPVIVMEPLRGGKLAVGLPEGALKLFAERGAEYSPAEWALRWVFSHYEVLTVLSGMSSLEVLEENIITASDEETYEISLLQSDMFDDARELIMGKTRVSCTSCGYCMPCNFGVDIPLCFSLYNDIEIEGGFKAFINYVQCAGAYRASLCTNCRKCIPLCPQGIRISDELKQVKKTFEGGIYKPLGAIIRKLMKTPNSRQTK